ncbi:MAG: SDR family oxidoreductase [Balneolaceae bacterium]|nr:SDR family oxidoreductase [Balneolaceae bacterium]
MPAYTVVTGASRGIGKAFATECASRGRDLILVSLPGEGLAELAGNLENRFGVQVAWHETDLTADCAVSDFYAWCGAKGFRIDMLINNAGLGSQGKFELSKPGEFQNIMQVNVNALVNMCWGALDSLKGQEQSHILNVGSIGAFIPLPYKAVYSASKHFVLAFSNALHYELKDSPVFVGCLCPGPTLTNDFHKEQVKEMGLKARLLTKTADEVARYGIDGILNRKRVIVPGMANKVITKLGRLLPTSYRLWLAGSTFSDSPFNHIERD